jgi:WD40 repeat protein
MRLTAARCGELLYASLGYEMEIVMKQAFAVWIFLALSQSVWSQEFITTSVPTMVFSVNDGETLSTSQLQIPDSITLIKLFPDQPPVSITVYGTTHSTIWGSPHALIIGQYGVVTNHTFRLSSSPESVTGRNEIRLVDLGSKKLETVSTIALDNQPWLALAHPDQRRIIVATSGTWIVYEITHGKLIEVSRSPTAVAVYSFDISSDGKTIIAAGQKGEASDENGVFHFSIDDQGAIKLENELESATIKIEGPFSPRISPDGTTAIILNGNGFSNGILDDALVIDLRGRPKIVNRIPQVGDGMESLAFHPSGEFAVISCLDSIPGSTTGHLALIDLRGDIPILVSHRTVDLVPEGIEFSSDGKLLFVGSAFASHISVYNVVGQSLSKSRFVLMTGAGHSALAIQEKSD